MLPAILAASITELFANPMISDGSRQPDQIVLENGLVRRVIQTTGFVGTISYIRTDSNEEFIRTIEPEARLIIDGVEHWLGGIQPMTNKAFLTPNWIASATASSKSLPLVAIRQTRPESRVPHKVDGKTWHPAGRAVEFEFSHPDFSALLTIEIYDGIPTIGKYVTIRPKEKKKIKVDQIISERLSLVEGESEVEANKSWRLPNVTVVTDMTFTGSKNTSTHWEPDPSYTTQVNYQLQTPCVLEVRPPNGIHSEIQNDSLRSVTAYTMLHSGTSREQNSLEERRLYRNLAPWVLDNPLMLHVVSNDDNEIRSAIDQASECGFEMVIMSFGSGLNMEDTSDANLNRWRKHREYANQKGVRFGGYSLLASRRIDDENDVINPKTGKTGGAIFGNSPCLGSEWGLNYFKKLKQFISETGFQLLEHDGNYPGDVCASSQHPGHSGLADSQWRQFQQVTEFYAWCREHDVFLNVPEYYFLNGSNKIAMGYRETNWSLPREEQHIHARQNLFDGTWSKTPSMGWMFVPLVEYHGGGPSATIEPLKAHLSDYEMHFANTFGYGAQACWRGTRLYDSPETKAVVVKMVNWYKANRSLLEADVIHLRRADGRRPDYVLHVLSGAVTEGILVAFNPLAVESSESLALPLSTNGFGKNTVVQFGGGRGVKQATSAPIKLKIPPKSWTWVKLTSVDN